MQSSRAFCLFVDIVGASRFIGKTLAQPIFSIFCFDLITGVAPRKPRQTVICILPFSIWTDLHFDQTKANLQSACDLPIHSNIVPYTPFLQNGVTRSTFITITTSLAERFSHKEASQPENLVGRELLNHAEFTRLPDTARGHVRWQTVGISISFAARIVLETLVASLVWSAHIFSPSPGRVAANCQIGGLDY
ncbi:hypothetical protein V2G26_019497 [Clonostachys chloroleuca]